jgi:hypothetical protein
LSGKQITGGIIAAVVEFTVNIGAAAVGIPAAGIGSAVGVGKRGRRVCG